MDKKAIVIGVGPERGLGAALCFKFAREGHHVFAAGRTREKLEQVVARIESMGGRASAVVADATVEHEVVALYDAAAAAEGDLDLAVYNAGNNMPGRIIDMSAAYFEQAWRLCCLGGFLFGREAARRMLPGGGCLLFTGASASLRGRANFGAFNAGKGALRFLAQAMAKEWGPEGLHVGHVVIDGGIGGEKIMQRRPERLAERGEEGLIELEALADAYWYLYRQPRRAWTFELDVRSFKESW